MLRDDPVSEPRPRRATILPPNRRQEIPALHVGPDAIPAEVHDVPAVRRRVGVDAYRSQGYADMSEATLTAPRPAITAVAAGDGSYPDTVTVTVDGVAHLVDVSVDRDDWQLPEVDADAVRLLWAIDDAIEAWHADNEPECRRIERVWAGAVSW